MSRLEISLPNEKICLEFIKLNDDVKVKWLKIAKEMYNKSIETVQCMTDENHKNVIELLKEKYNNKKLELEMNLEGERQMRSTIEERYIHRIQSVEREIKEGAKIIYTEKIHNLKEEIQKQKIIISQKNDKINQIRENKYNELESKRKELERVWMERIENLRNEKDKKIEEERKKSEKLFLRKQNSSLIGADGEEICLSNLTLLFPAAKIEDTHTEAGRGDFFFNYKDINLMIENKNYSRNVPKKEIDKFYRDIENNSDILGGILCSQKSGIANREDFCIEIIKGKPIIMLHNTNNNNNKIKVAIELLMGIIKTNIDFNKKEIIDAVKLSSKIIRQKFNRIRKELSEHQRKMTELIFGEGIEQEIRKILLYYGVNFK